MSDALLPYYDRELNAIRRLAAEFADAHPKIAGRLRLSADAVDDPHVARLLEGVAFLSARVHHRLDDEFPELTDTLLGVLYPHYLAPVPSAAIVQFDCTADLTIPTVVPAGLMLDTEPMRGETCRFRTTRPVTLWPIEIESVRLTGQPLAAPAKHRPAGAVSVLRIALTCANPQGSFAALGIDRLRLFLRGPANVTLPLYEILCGHTLAVACAEGIDDEHAVLAGPEALAPVGFAAEEALLPWPARSFAGFRLLTEYFAFPEKFLFVDLLRLDARSLMLQGGRMEVFVYLDQSMPELERTLGTDNLALGAVPVINLFPQRCEPVALTGTETEYRVVPDLRRPGATEIWSVERVRETRPDGSSRPWRPFYRLTHGDVDAATPGGFYQAVRRAAGPALGGSETFLAVHDPAYEAEAAADSVLSIEALCTNRDLPASLPFGGGHPHLSLVEGLAAISRITCLTAPTAPLRAPLRERAPWRLVSHLALGHLSVVGGAEAAAALKEVLRLYDVRASAETRAAIDGLVSVSARTGTARVPQARLGSFCRGLDVTLSFDPRTWQAGGLYLLAAVLDRFLALHATVNSFVRTNATLRGRAGSVAAWPPRAGTRTLL